jgi:hypothetical protein
MRRSPTFRKAVCVIIPPQHAGAAEGSRKRTVETACRLERCRARVEDHKEKTMNPILIGLASAATIALAVPAAAQYGNNNQWNANRANTSAGVNVDFSNRIDQLEERLEDGIDAGTIDRTEARSLRQQVRQLARLEAQYGRDGIDQQERRELQQRIRTVRQQLRVADNGNDGRYRDWDRWDREDGYAQNNGNDGRWNNGPGSRYQEVSEVCSQRGTAVTAILRNIFGADNCLRVGERASTSLSALPSQYRNDFRDGSGFYYRYVDGNVVQVDSRTNVVARIYDVG